jgi:hypothetical protein
LRDRFEVGLRVVLRGGRQELLLVGVEIGAGRLPFRLEWRGRPARSRLRGAASLAVLLFGRAVLSSERKDSSAPRSAGPERDQLRGTRTSSTAASTVLAGPPSVAWMRIRTVLPAQSSIGIDALAHAASSSFAAPCSWNTVGCGPPVLDDRDRNSSALLAIRCVREVIAERQALPRRVGTTIGR